MVQVSELSFSSLEGEPIFSDFHLQLERGGILCIVGGPATGKTLLLRLLCREIRPQHGQILIDNCNITRLSPERFQGLRARIGVMPQYAQPLRRRTLSDNLSFKLRAFGLLPKTAALKVKEILLTVGLDESRDRYLEELSTGEARLFQLALAIGHDPVLLLIDDPICGLSEREGERVLSALHHVQQRRRLTVLATSRTVSIAETLGAPTIRLISQIKKADSKAGPESLLSTSQPAEG
jgi:ABC-type ATPase involved in cell division